MINKILSTSSALIKKIVGSRNDRILKGIQPLVVQVNSLEPQIKALSDGELRAKTDEFKKRLTEGAGLDSLIPEAFAVVRETARRTIQMRHFDSQLITFT
jgi:preprotein translocase subunit SecA